MGTFHIFMCVEGEEMADALTLRMSPSFPVSIFLFTSVASFINQPFIKQK